MCFWSWRIYAAQLTQCAKTRPNYAKLRSSKLLQCCFNVFKSTSTICLKLFLRIRNIVRLGFFWPSVTIRTLHTSNHCVLMIFSATYLASYFVIQKDILDVISTVSFLPPWFVYLPKNLRMRRCYIFSF